MVWLQFAQLRPVCVWLLFVGIDRLKVKLSFALASYGPVISSEGPLIPPPNLYLPIPANTKKQPLPDRSSHLICKTGFSPFFTNYIFDPDIFLFCRAISRFRRNETPSVFFSLISIFHACKWK